MLLVSSCSCLCSVYWSQVLSRERCFWSSADRRWSNFIWVINNFIAYYGVTYNRGLKVIMSAVLWHSPEGNISVPYDISLEITNLKSLMHLKNQWVNSLWPSDAIWRQMSGSTLAQVMACCLTAPSHYLNQCWLIIRKVEWYASKGKFTRDNSAINHWNYLANQVPRISFKFPRGQWVKRKITVSKGVWTHWTVLCIIKQHFPQLQFALIPLSLILILSLINHHHSILPPCIILAHIQHSATQ